MKLVRGTKSATRSATRKKTLTKTASVAAAPAKTGSNGQNGSKSVTIEAKVDVGFGNTLYLRGEGHGLSWTQGIPLTCVDSSTWAWSGEASDSLKFKLLLNDSVWAKGEDLVAEPGAKLQITPAF